MDAEIIDEVKENHAEPKENKFPPREILLDSNGKPLPRTLEENYRVAQSMYNSRALPKWVDSPIKAMMAFQYCKELNLPPLVTINNMCMINGQINIWGELPLALARRSGKLKFFNEFLINERYEAISFENRNLTDEIFAAVCVVERIDSERKTYHFSVKDLEKANKGVKAIWDGYKSVMMKRKARALAMKDQFGDVLLGATIAEYTNEILPDHEVIEDKTNEPTAADKLNALYNKEKKESEITAAG